MNTETYRRMQDEIDALREALRDLYDAAMEQDNKERLLAALEAASSLAGRSIPQTSR